MTILSSAAGNLPKAMRLPRVTISPAYAFVMRTPSTRGPDSPANHLVRFRATALRLVAALLAVMTIAAPLAAQNRVGRDSSTRLARYGHDLEYGTALGFGYAGIDQLRDNPPEWGKGWSGYGKRLASNVGEFVIQETVTDILAAAMDRPLDYQRCRCSGTGRRLRWVAMSAVTDPTPDRRHHSLAVPRILGAFAGSFAQASWRPNTGSRTSDALVNGATSLLIGAGINAFYEFRHRGTSRS
jgi:hypothetical protein